MSYACPDGQYEMCIAHNPFGGGCATKICVPNGGSVFDAASDSLAELNQGVIHLGNEIVRVPENVGKGLADTASKIDFDKAAEIDWQTGLLVITAIANGVACVASDGAAPGQGVDSGAVLCSQNACACAAISLAMAIKNRSNMSEDEQQSIQQWANDPKYAEIQQRTSTQLAVDQQISALRIRKLAHHGSGRPGRPLEDSHDDFQN